MARLILHVGPGKCGSSSIQEFFSTRKRPCIQKTRYKLLNPSLVSELNCEEPEESLLSAFAKQLSGNLKRCDALILSQEYLFETPYAVKNICRLAQNLTESICIIGYSRRQADLLVSSYSQWLFRSPDRIHEVTDELDKLGLDPVLFDGLERQIIASIANDFYSARLLSEYNILDWNNSYDNILRLVHGYGVAIKCGTLPNKKSDTPLIHDFCAKADLTLHPKIKDAAGSKFNPSFNQEIIEAINNAVILGLEVPSPHKCNHIIELLSTRMKPIKSNPSEFLSSLRLYIDSYFWGSNEQLCKKYNLDQTYFLPAKMVSKPEIMDIVFHEGHHRSLNKSALIEKYRELSARMIELCIASHILDDSISLRLLRRFGLLRERNVLQELKRRK